MMSQNIFCNPGETYQYHRKYIHLKSPLKSFV